MATQPVIRRSSSSTETELIAAELAATLCGGNCIALHGDLGAGKTQFVRGLVAGVAGPWRRVNSPTYSLLNIYEGGRLTVYHLDAYRVKGAGDFDAIGFPELLEQGAIVAVEWASRVMGILPERRIDVSIESVDMTIRLIQIEHRV
jgi:tRNA threonylcarbamoyladenosine biosynthesis protein TsaE